MMPLIVINFSLQYVLIVAYFFSLMMLIVSLEEVNWKKDVFYIQYAKWCEKQFKVKRKFL